MKIGVLGTGPVGQAIAAKLAELGHGVLVGTRDPAATLARTDNSNPLDFSKGMPPSLRSATRTRWASRSSAPFPTPKWSRRSTR